MVTLDETQHKWKIEHHASVNPKNFAQRKKVIEAFLKDPTKIDDRLVQYVHKTFFTQILDEFGIKYHINEHKATLWEKVKRHYQGKPPLDTAKKTSITKEKKPIPAKKTSIVKDQKPATAKKTSRKKTPVAEEKKPMLDTAKKQAPALSCTQVLQALLLKYQKKAIPSKVTLEAEARKLLHEAEHDLARAVTIHAIASLQAHARVPQKAQLEIPESETETEEEEQLGSSETEADEEPEEKHRTTDLGPGPEPQRSLETVFKDLQSSRLSKAQLTKQFAQVVSEYEFLEVYDMLTNHVHDIQHVTKFDALYKILLQYARHVLQRASSEFPETKERDDFAVQELLDIFKKFDFSQTEASKFIDDITPNFPPTLKKILLRKL